MRIDSDDETDGTPLTAQPSTSKADNIGKSAETTIPSAAGEMERRAEEKVSSIEAQHKVFSLITQRSAAASHIQLLDVRIREKYQKGK
jgi:hypothetical protein